MIDQQLIEPSQQQNILTTNVVLVEKKKKNTYFLPCYVRFKVKELINVNIDDLTASVSGTLLFSFSYGNLNPKFVDKFVEGDKSILLQFSRQESLQLTEEKGITIKRDDKEKMVDYTIRQQFTCYIKGDVFFTPFQVNNLFLTITIQTIHLGLVEGQDKRTDIKFNCMTHRQALLISHGQKCHHGLFSMANNFLGLKYTCIDKNPFQKISIFDKQEDDAKGTKKVDDAGEDIMNSTKKLIVEKNEEQSAEKIKKVEMEDKKVKHFQYAHIRVPLYKHPGVTLLEIFIPLWILGLINIFVFFQQNVMADKMATIATVALAYVAFIPTINATVPNTPEIKLIDILIYMNILTTILTMIDSVITLRTKDASYVFQWQTNGWFWATVVIDLFSVIVIIILFILHKALWQRVYISKENEKKKKKDISRKLWYNYDCDQQFQNDLKLRKIVAI